MPRTTRFAFGYGCGLLVLCLVLAGCDDGHGPCGGISPHDACGSRCGAARACPDGFFCTEGQCAAECFAGTSKGCASGRTCTANGRCTADQEGGVFTGDGSPFGDLDGGLTQTDGGATLGDGSVCASQRVGTARVTPTVMLIVDQSGSMTTCFTNCGGGGGLSRWDVLDDTLFAMPGGLVHEFQSRVRFGMALYTSTNGGGSTQPATGECPRLRLVQPAIDNYGPIDSEYEEADPVEDTPTGDAVDAVLDRIEMGPDQNANVVFILVTDGEPDRCEQGDPNPHPEAQEEAVSAVARAHDQDIETFLVDVGNGVSESLKQEVANAGQGIQGMQDAPFWTATNDSGLRDALREIIGGQVSCEVELDGEIQDLSNACSGTVELNGQPLPCNDPDGWRVVDESTVELQGAACEDLKSDDSAALRATFPCDTIAVK